MSYNCEGVKPENSEGNVEKTENDASIWPAVWEGDDDLGL